MRWLLLVARAAAAAELYDVAAAGDKTGTTTMRRERPSRRRDGRRGPVQPGEGRAAVDRIPEPTGVESPSHAYR
jgi:hypothetical protein